MQQMYEHPFSYCDGDERAYVVVDRPIVLVRATTHLYGQSRYCVVVAQALRRVRSGSTRAAAGVSAAAAGTTRFVYEWLGRV